MKSDQKYHIRSSVSGRVSDDRMISVHVEITNAVHVAFDNVMAQRRGLPELHVDFRILGACENLKGQETSRGREKFVCQRT